MRVCRQCSRPGTVPEWVRRGITTGSLDSTGLPTIHNAADQPHTHPNLPRSPPGFLPVQRQHCTGIVLAPLCGPWRTGIYLPDVPDQGHYGINLKPVLNRHGAKDDCLRLWGNAVQLNEKFLGHSGLHPEPLQPRSQLPSGYDKSLLPAYTPFTLRRHPFPAQCARNVRYNRSTVRKHDTTAAKYRHNHEHSNLFRLRRSGL